MFNVNGPSPIAFPLHPGIQAVAVDDYGTEILGLVAVSYGSLQKYQPILLTYAAS